MSAATGEDSNATGINGDQQDNSIFSAGAVYLFRNDGDGWTQQAYIKASNNDGGINGGQGDGFGGALALSADGNTLVVGSPGEDSRATGVNGDQADNSCEEAGAVYVFKFANDRVGAAGLCEGLEYGRG